MDRPWSATVNEHEYFDAATARDALQEAVERVIKHAEMIEPPPEGESLQWEISLTYDGDREEE